MASATAFADKYQYDPFLRTQVNVIGMLGVFSIFLLILVGIVIDYLYHDISVAIISGVRASIAASSTAPIAETVPSINTIRTEKLTMISFITAAATIAFGYLLTRVALGPTRNALASQKQFIGNVAHELRTPLAVIKTNTEVALLSQDIPFDTQAIMNSNIEELDRASQIIMNVVKNAINYTPRGGRISVTVEQISTPGNGLPAHVEIIVSDSGAGIARQDLFHIFEPFYRAEQSRNRSYGGSGLGLAIVSELVKLHHGKITVRSAVGRGTTVSISLPSATVPASDHSLRHRKILDEVAVDFSHRRM